MKKVALIMDAWKRVITSEWASGIMQRFRETNEDVNLYIFNSFGNWSWDKEYSAGEYNIYKLPDLNEFDGIVLDVNHAGDCKEAREVTFNAMKSGKPVITIGGKVDGCYYVGIDNYTVMTNVIAHLYEKHACRKFWFIMGPRGSYENATRVRALKDFMSDNGIEYAESDFYYESFEYSGGYRGFKALLNKSELESKIPDAVICVNDSVALGVINAAAEFGYKVPADMKVTGFDNLDKASMYSPKITTVGYLKEEIGYQCADILVRIWQGKRVNRLNFTSVNHIYWDSCGCKSNKRSNRAAYTKAQIMNEVDREEFEEQIMALEYDLSNCRAVSDVSDCLPNGISAYKCEAMYLILDEHMRDIYKKSFSGDENFCVKGYPKKMFVEFAFDINKGYLKNFKSIAGLFPMFDYEKGCTSFLFVPIHFSKYTVGFLVMRNADYLMKKNYVFRVMNMLVTTIKNLHDKERLEYMNKMLVDTNIKDAMTGLYNRKAYDGLVREYFETKKKKKENLLVMFIDMDRLKYINDTFGHEYGDTAIKIISKAILDNCSKTAIPVRNGGDEFVIIHDVITNIEYEKMVLNMRKDIVAEAKGRRLPFELSFSIGAVHTDMHSKMTVEDYVRLADEMMYEEKVLKKANRKD